MDDSQRTRTSDESSENQPERDLDTGARRRDFMKTAAATAAVPLVASAGTGVAGAQSADGIPTPWLDVEGNKLRDPNGNDVILRGVNIADPKRLDVTAPARGKNAEQAVDLVTDPNRDWYARVVRIPVQPVDIGEHEPGAGPEPVAFTEAELEDYLETHLDPVIERCRERGVYAIVDYHRHRDIQWNDETLDEEVRMFWDIVAPRYADRSHVMYEVYNEPTEPGIWGDPTEQDHWADTWRDWKATAQPWVDIIREHAPRNIVLIGSPSWTQSPEGALVEEFEGENLAYTYHIYAGHTSSGNLDWEDASGENNGEGVAGVYEEVPLFVTEFGWENASETDRFLRGTTSEFGEAFYEWLDSNPIHWTAWCADPIWRPIMFERGFTDEEDVDSIGNPYDGGVEELCSDLPCEWDLLGGEDYMGEYTKEMLARRRNDDLPGEGSGGEEDTTVPTAPPELSVAGRTSSSIDLSWDSATDAGGSGLEAYVVSVDGETDHTVAAGTTETTVDGLESSTSYEFGVTAVDGAGNESEPTTLTASTLSADGDETAPSEPTNLAVTDATTSSVDVTWDASSDEGGSGLDGYNVYLDGELDGTVGADTTAATVDGLAADAEYEIGVAAVDGAGNVSETATVTATTAADGGPDPDALVVNDYDGDPSWPGENDLGNWNGAGSLANGGGSGEVVDGALELAYDGAGWAVEQVMQDVSEYTELVVRVSGAAGGEGDHFSIALGGAQATFSSVADREIGTSPADVRIDLEAMGVDRASPGELRLNFWEGGAGASAIAIEEIRLE